MLKKTLSHKPLEIKFVCVNPQVHKSYSPKPTTDFLPSWYKEMESYAPSKGYSSRTSKMATIKKCMPVFDALTAGYVILTPCDIYVSFQNGEVEYESALPNIISKHPRKQAYAHPQGTFNDFPKWESPWSIQTPKGYSCLFLPLMHNPNPWFEILEGIVDTDNYQSSVNFPFILKETLKDFIIPAGTPIAQVIPFKRTNWKLKIAENNNGKAVSDTNYILSGFFNQYKNAYWNKKSFK